MLSIGLMSGTSMDGCDAALLETDGDKKHKLHAFYPLAYELSFKRLLKTAEWAVRASHGDLIQAESLYPQAIQAYLKDELKIRDTQQVQDCIQAMKDYLGTPLNIESVIQHSTELHAVAVESLLQKTGHKSQDIQVVGYHGQTWYHQPSRKISVIVGNGQYLADRLQIKVVSDFRRADIDRGGQGAPFAPLYHQVLVLGHQPAFTIPVAVVNCGGIANVTIIQSPNPADLMAFDTGPGNALIDRLVRQRTQGLEHMDKDGQYGAQGRVHPGILKALHEKSVLQGGIAYFLKAVPKSLDIHDMDLIPELEALSLEDACATLGHFTAETIVNSVQALNISLPRHWVLAGGGWNNPVIRYALADYLDKALGQAAWIQSADELGWDSQSLEAQMFAYYAVRRLQNRPMSFPGTTGVSEPTCGGVLYQPQLL